MKISRIMLIISCFLMLQMVAQSLVAQPSIYLWEQFDDSGRSCCLHMNGTDICNPYVACTRFVPTDMASILEYISRILSTDRGNIEPHHTLLIQVQRYIRSVLQDSFYTISYRLDQHRSVQFYHLLIEAAIKNKDKNSGKNQVEKQKPKNDYVTQKLIAMGLYHPHKLRKKL